jgi:small-conductance mechanosensitive channel
LHLQDHHNQVDQLTESIKTLVAAQNKTNSSLERIEKRMKGMQVVEEYEDEFPERGREIKYFQEPEILENGRNKYSEERRINARQYDEDDH